MKKLLLSFVVIALVGCVYNQNVNSPTLDGIGILRLGSHIGLLDSLDGTLFNNPYRKIVGYDNYKNVISNKRLDFDYYITELLPSEKDKKDQYYFGEASLFDSVRVFHIPVIEIVDDVLVGNVILKFYKDSLYSVKMDHSYELAGLLTEKYGQPKSKKQKDSSGINETERWNTNLENISCLHRRFIGKYSHSDYIELNDFSISYYVNREQYKMNSLNRQKVLDKL